MKKFFLSFLLCLPLFAQAHPWHQLPRTLVKEENKFYFQEKFGERYLFVGDSKIGSFRMIAKSIPNPMSPILGFSISCQFFFEKTDENIFIEFFDNDFNVIARYDVTKKRASGNIELETLEQIKSFLWTFE